MNSSEVTVIVITLNEEKGIGPTLKEFIYVLGDLFLLVVDDNSVDGTIQNTKELGAEVIFQKVKEKVWRLLRLWSTWILIHVILYSLMPITLIQLSIFLG